MTIELHPGLRLRSTVCDTEVVVVRAPAHSVDIRCGGAPMTTEEAPDASDAPAPPHDRGTLVGKRYTTGDDALEVLCTRAGAGSLSAGDEAMAEKGAKPLPSSD